MAKDEIRKSARRVTICETLRKITDECQGDAEKDVRIRGIVQDAVGLAKRMSARMKFYANHFHNGIPWDDKMWKKNRDVYVKRALREDPDYKA